MSERVDALREQLALAGVLICQECGFTLSEPESDDDIACPRHGRDALAAAPWKDAAEHYREVCEAVGQSLDAAHEEIERLTAALEPFALMDRAGCDLNELACRRGVASDQTVLFSRDFRRAADALRGVDIENEVR